MNILLFVTSLLMILSLLTYARIDNFRYFLGMQSEFEHYMKSVERIYTNNSAEIWYKTSRAKVKDSKTTPETPGTGPTKPDDPNKTPEAKPIDLTNPTPAEAIDPTKPVSDKEKPEASGVPTSHMSVRVLFNQKMREGKEEAYVQTREWLKQLMKELYGKQKFYTEMVDKNADFLNEMISYLENLVAEMPEDDRPKSAADLANLDIPNMDNDYWITFYRMLKGCKVEEDIQALAPVEDEKKAKVWLVGEEGTNEEDETDAAEEALEYSARTGYDSLLNYISMRNTTKIRVYTASRELLTAIFGAQTAEAVIEKRMNLYRAVMADMSASDASKQFQAAFSGMEAEDSKSMLDFKVTKTNPSEYD